jgi:uncharacterized membrane protein YheB (UPF0754 family)
MESFISQVPSEVITSLAFLLPPLLGAFIGYVTNRVAIRMLFRPLKAMRILGIKVPMTPGVIPSKRHELAINIGEMVGEHLLTSKEVGGALAKKKFQNHLYGLIKGRVERILTSDLGPLPTLIPNKYSSYFDISVKMVNQHLQTNINEYVDSDSFAKKVKTIVDSRYDDFLKRDLETLIEADARQSAYAFIDKNLARMIESETLEHWVEDYIHQKIHNVLLKGQSCEHILPETLRKLFLKTIEEQTPALLEKFADILNEPEMQEKIVGGVKEGVENFIESLGPMSAMVHNFISPDLIDEKVREYLKDKEDDIVVWLQNPDVQVRVAKGIQERAHKYMQTPIGVLIPDDFKDKVNSFGSGVSQQILAVLREEATISTLSNMIRDNLEVHIKSGSLTVKDVLVELGGGGSVELCRKWINIEVLQLLRSQNILNTINAMVESMMSSLLSKRIGKLDRILPEEVRDGMYGSLQVMASDMLANEVPGLVDSLNLKQIVAEKVDSLDLLRLEGLLLSIMEEQFKYINLFGALLGFIIGCCNLLFLSIL